MIQEPGDEAASATSGSSGSQTSAGGQSRQPGSGAGYITVTQAEREAIDRVKSFFE